MYRVVITERAKREAEACYRWWATNRSKSQADRWSRQYFQVLKVLKKRPAAYPLSRESGDLGVEIRDLCFGAAKRSTHRIVFQICDTDIVVVGVRHLAQDDLSLDDLTNSE
jgi:plasmid stabilization system protein ParE